MLAKDRDDTHFPSGLRLTPRELEGLRLTHEGLDDRQMCRALGIGEPTLRTYVQSLHRKLGASHRTGLLKQARERGLL